MDSKKPYVIVTDDRQREADLRNILAACGIKTVTAFSSLERFRAYATDRACAVVLVYADPAHVPVLQTVKSMQTDSSAGYNPLILILPDGISLANDDVQLLKTKYKVRKILHWPVEYKELKSEISLSSHEDGEVLSIQSQMRQAKDMYRDGFVKKAAALFEKILDSDESNLIAQTGLVHAADPRERDMAAQVEKLMKADPTNFNFSFELLSSTFALFGSALGRKRANNFK